MEWLVLGWIGCGVLSYGLHFGYFQRRFPDLAEGDYKVDLFMSIACGVFGPIGLLAIIYVASANRGLAGFKWK